MLLVRLVRLVNVATRSSGLFRTGVETDNFLHVTAMALLQTQVDVRDTAAGTGLAQLRYARVALSRESLKSRFVESTPW